MSDTLDVHETLVPAREVPLYYLYCFSRPGSANHLSIPGIQDGPPAMEVVVNDIAAIISKVDPGLMAPLIQEDLAVDPDALVRLALDHDRVIGAVLHQAPVLPVRFGSVFSSPDVLFHYLNHGHAAIASFLDKLKDQQEWSVKLLHDCTTSTRHIAAEDPVFKDRWMRLAPTPGVRYLQEQRFWADVNKESAKRAHECVGQFLQFSESHLGHYHPLKKGASLPDGASVLWNGAFILNPQQQSMLAAYADMQNQQSTATGLTVVATGPWPPYSFCPRLEEIA